MLNESSCKKFAAFRMMLHESSSKTLVALWVMLHESRCEKLVASRVYRMVAYNIDHNTG